MSLFEHFAKKYQLNPFISREVEETFPQGEIHTYPYGSYCEQCGHRPQYNSFEREPYRPDPPILNDICNYNNIRRWIEYTELDTNQILEETIQDVWDPLENRYYPVLVNRRVVNKYNQQGKQNQYENYYQAFVNFQEYEEDDFKETMQYSNTHARVLKPPKDEQIQEKYNQAPQERKPIQQLEKNKLKTIKDLNQDMLKMKNNSKEKLANDLQAKLYQRYLMGPNADMKYYKEETIKELSQKSKLNSIQYLYENQCQECVDQAERQMLFKPPIDEFLENKYGLKKITTVQIFKMNDDNQPEILETKVDEEDLGKVMELTTETGKKLKDILGSKQIELQKNLKEQGQKKIQDSIKDRISKLQDINEDIQDDTEYIYEQYDNDEQQIVKTNNDQDDQKVKEIYSPPTNQQLYIKYGIGIDQIQQQQSNSEGKENQQKSNLSNTVGTTSFKDKSLIDSKESSELIYERKSNIDDYNLSQYNVIKDQQQVYETKLLQQQQYYEQILAENGIRVQSNHRSPLQNNEQNSNIPNVPPNTQKTQSNTLNVNRRVPNDQSQLARVTEARSDQEQSFNDIRNQNFQTPQYYIDNQIGPQGNQYGRNQGYQTMPLLRNQDNQQYYQQPVGLNKYYR